MPGPTLNPFSRTRWIVVFFLFTLPNLCSVSFSDFRLTEPNLACGNSTGRSNGANYISGFVQEMENLAKELDDRRWSVSFMNSTPPIYGLAQCFDDLSKTDCILCYAAIRTRVPRCLPATAARIYFDGCFLRYDTYEFYNQSIDPGLDFTNCTPAVRSISGNSTEAGFAGTVARAMGNATEIAAARGGFGVGQAKGAAETVYALAQCWETVSREGCGACLEKAARETRRCAPRREGRALYTGCYLRYSTMKFYGNRVRDDDTTGKLSKGVIAAIVCLAAALLMLSLCAGYAAKVKLSKIRRERGNLSRIAFRRSSFYFKYETLEKATLCFNPARKLGQGGGGSVFMGSLQDGKVVAVKRLVFNTRQWADVFFNEVNLIAGIQHKNLVKLLGCSIEGPESLLVYEYVPNKSIDDYMSDNGMRQTLHWKQRVNIIIGIAEGLAYLHGGTQITIIHRDIKGSNVLLDENLDPKISDFGLVRCFGSDRTHLSTGVAGTLGYLAPEYLLRGQLTDKADVYSFGVLVMEIVSGRKSRALLQDSSSLLQTIWKLYKSKNVTEAVDPSMGGDFPCNEVSKVLQIALLCTQALVALRPSMAEVVQMLNSKDYEIPAPNQPPFMYSSVLGLTSSRMSSSVNSSSPITTMGIEGCTTSGESSDKSRAFRNIDQR